jgi:hypothetical protein
MARWHPIFAQLLRPLVEAYYEVRTDVPVGEAARQADIVLLRRTSRGALPFRGLWRHLTTWNILEFKGPTVSPRDRDLDRLAELGLGIDRRLNEERARERRGRLRREEVSVWYLANHLGRRFLRRAEQLLPAWEPLGAGLWRGVLLQRPLFLVSVVDLPVEEDSVPLHLVGREPRETELAVARLVVEQPPLWVQYGNWLATLHPGIWEEIEAMAQRKHGEFLVDFRPVIQKLGLRKVIEQIGVDHLLEQIGPKELVRHLGLDGIVEGLTPAERRELKRRLE